MKARPNIERFSEPKKDPAAFLQGAAATTADRMVVAAPATKPAKQPEKKQKIFWLRPETIAAIEREVYERSLRQERITHSELAEQALAAFLK